MAREGYTIPGLKNYSLFSIKKLFQVGCKVIFNNTECVVLHNGKEVTKGTKNENNGLWYVPITSHSSKQYAIQGNRKMANTIYNSSILAETIQFLHQCMFSPKIDTLCKAIDRNQLIGFQAITSALIQKYLPESTATAKGHMN
jgi:hypothetical protein